MKYYGKIGYVNHVMASPGVYVEEVEERYYCGDILRSSGKWQGGEHLNDDIDISNEFSIVADSYAFVNFQQMRYIEYMGVLWKINSVTVNYPRLVLSVGGVYNGKTAD